MTRLPWNIVAITRFFAAFFLSTFVFLAQAAPANGPINYVYDELGRLVGVSDAAGNSATYKYDAVGNILTISRATAAQVSLSEFTPNSGPAGTTVTIFGSGFSTTANQNTVTFNLTAASVVSATAIQIVVVVPSGATTGPIKITTPTGSVTSVSAFTVGPSLAPTIAGFTPIVGSAGTAVTISGSNYQTTLSNNKVQFNNRVTTISSATATSIVAPVPVSTASGKIAVSTPYGAAISSADFFVPPPPYTAADIQVTDRMAIGQSKTVTITTAGKKGLILFDGNAGQRVSMMLSAFTLSGTVSILRPDGTLLASTGIATYSSFLDAQTLPATGTYTILIDASATSTGSVTMALNNIQDVTGTITIGGSTVTLTTTVPGQNASLRFNGTAGQRISLYVTAISPALGCPYFSIVNPDGTILVAPGVSCATTFFTDVKTLPATGTYTIVMDPGGAVVGSATFSVYDVPPDASGSIMIGGPAVTVTTTVPGQNASLIFSGTAGQKLSFGFTNLTVSPAGCYYLALALYRPDGTSLAAQNIFSPSGGFDLPALPVTGTYSLVVDPAGTCTASMSVSLSEELAGTIAIGGPAVTVTTTIPAQDARLTFSGAAGQKLSFGFTNMTVSPAGCYLALALYRPDGTTLASTSYLPPPSGGFDLPALPVPGSYSLVINPNGGCTASMSVSLSEELAGTIAIGGPAVTVTTTIPAQNARLTFSGVAGQKVSLYGSGATFTGCIAYSLSILNPDGTALVNDTGSCSPTYFSDALTLPASGTYTILVNPGGVTTGSITLQLNDVPPDATATLSIGGPLTTVTTTAPGQNAYLTFGGTAGQIISVNSSGATFTGCPAYYNYYISTRNPDGTALINDTGSCSQTYSSGARTLPMSGTYTILINPGGPSVGSISVAVTSP